MDIDLIVNSMPIKLGMIFSEETLVKANIRKMGFFMNLTFPHKKKPGDNIYWAKNPLIHCFKETAYVLPMQKSDDPDLYCGSSAFFFFNENKLRLVILQCFVSYIWAHEFTKEFRKGATNNFGESEKSEIVPVTAATKPLLYTKDASLLNKWERGNEVLISELSATGKSAYVYWGYQ